MAIFTGFNDDPDVPFSEKISEFEYRVDVVDDLLSIGNGQYQLWEQIRGMICPKIERRVGSTGHEKAEFTYTYGHRVRDEATGTLEERPRQEIKGKFVRVTVGVPDSLWEPNEEGAPAMITEPEIVWYGFIMSESRSRAPVEDVSETAAPEYTEVVGVQKFLAVGLTYFLDRTIIDSAVCYKDDTETQRIKRPLIFNGGTNGQFDPQWKGRGNKQFFTDDPVLTDDLHQIPVFDNPINNSKTNIYDDGMDGFWTTYDIARYLLHWFQPEKTDQFGNPLHAATVGNEWPALFELKYDEDDDDSTNTYRFTERVRPTMRTDRTTVFQALNQLMNPKRGLVWWLDTSALSEIAPQLRIIKIRVQSTLEADIPLITAETFLRGNSDQQEWNFDDDVHVNTPVINSSESYKYKSVRVRGALRTSTMTLSPDTFLSKNWSSVIELKYRNAGLTVPPNPVYTAMDKLEKAAYNDTIRSNEKFEKVFASVKIEDDWDGKSNDGSNDTPFEIANPNITHSGSAGAESASFRVAGLRFLRSMPLKIELDYSIDPSDPVETEDATNADYRAPFCVVPVDGVLPEQDAQVWQYAEKLNKVSFPGSAFDEMTSYRLSVEQQYAAFNLSASGSLNHVLEKEQWNENNAQPWQEDKVMPEVNWYWLRYTGCLEYDEYAEASFPDVAVDSLDELIIDMGPTFRMDYLARNTIVDIDHEGKLVTQPVGGFVRNDWEALNTLARAAYSYYKNDRASIDVVIEKIYGEGQFRLGLMITKIGDPTKGNGEEFTDTINSTITNLQFILSTGKQAMRVTTVGGEVDFSSAFV